MAKQCAQCGGSGTRECPLCSGKGCGLCDGAGTVTCPDCHGSGER
jgi:hypothetical protein